MKRIDILVIGGGISGLSCLHFLKSKNSDADVYLLEREGMCGGTVHSLSCSGLIFEHGPNGVLANQPLTLKLFSDLGLDGQIVEASSSSKKRYILKNGRLNPVPSNPLGLMASGYLMFPEMIRAAAEIFVPSAVRAGPCARPGKGQPQGVALTDVSTGVRRDAPVNTDETVFDFACRRFGAAAAEKLFDPLIKGIYGGNARQLHMKSAFPKIACLEDEHGSVIRGMIRRKRCDKNSNPKKLLSFKGGMQAVVDALSKKYAEHIRCGVDVRSIQKSSAGYLVETSSETLEARRVVLSVPAYAAAKLLQHFDADLSRLLDRIEYAPIAVVGMVFSRKDWACPVEGYGYLVASSEQTPVLGVLFEDQIFQRDHDSGKMLLRVMVGGSDFPDVVRKNPQEIQAIVRDHLKKVLGIASEPAEVMMKIWPKAIPQYTVEYSRIKAEVSAQLSSHPNLHLLANYWNGVSFNDCVENASRI